MHSLQIKCLNTCLLNATTLIEAMKFYSTNKWEIKSIVEKFHTQKYPTHRQIYAQNFVLLDIWKPSQCILSWWNKERTSSFHRSLSKIFEHKIAIIFLPSNLNIYFGWSKEPSHWDSCFEHPQQMFCWEIKKKNQVHTFIWGPDHFYGWKKCFVHKHFKQQWNLFEFILFSNVKKHFLL